MEEFAELTCVRETEHLVPNLPRLASVLFGAHSYFLDWRKSHIDWATAKCKHPDGLVWCPWTRELWLVEAEWKEESNFFEQCRAFASGRVDRESLSKALRTCLDEMADVVNSAAPSLRENLLLTNIVKETLDCHFQDKELRPHAWVVLGHDAKNIDELRSKYERELQDRFKDSQRYILSMVRMFKNESAAFLLVEQHGPSLGSINVKEAILVPAVLTGGVVESLPDPIDRAEPSRDAPIGTRSLSTVSQASSQASDLSTTWSSRKKRKLEVKILERKKLWEAFVEQGQMSVQEFKQLSDFPAKTIGGFFRVLTHNGIAKQFGDEFTLCDEAVPFIRHTLVTDQERISSQSHPTPDYFESWPGSKRHRVEARILMRRKLWEAYLEKKQMTPEDFKLLSNFRSKGVAGFANFITMNGFATRHGNTFTLSASAMAYLQRILNKEE